MIFENRLIGSSVTVDLDVYYYHFVRPDWEVRPDEKPGMCLSVIRERFRRLVLRVPHMFVPVRNRMFRFKSPEKQIQELFVKKFVEVINHHPELVPSITTGKRKLNELMVSYLRHGRMELVEMVRAFQVQMQETQRDESKMSRR